jgi:putative ABC transport system substrate-binding protein
MAHKGKWVDSCRFPIPIGQGVARLARPGGNITGFTNFEFSISGKWLETLKRDHTAGHAPASISRPQNFQ